MLNPQFPNYANSAAGTEVIGWTVVGGQPLYRLPVAYVDTGFGAAFVCEGSTLEAPTYPEGVYLPDPDINSPGVITGTAAVGQTLTFTPGDISGTAPITATYNWIRYIPGGQSVIVGTGLNYSPVSGDITHQLIVQTVASNSVATVATQTLPYGPVVASAPVITNAGTLVSIPPNSGGAAAIGSVTLTNPGQDYVYLLGAPDVTVTGNGNGAIVTATLAEEGSVVATGSPTGGVGTPGATGTVTISGEGSETDIVLNWVAAVATGEITLAIVNPGSGWTQANASAVDTATYGTVVYTNSGDITTAPNLGLYIGVPLAGLTLVNGGSGYTVAGLTITPATGDIFGNGATGSATIDTANVVYPTQLASYSGPTVTGFSPQVSWVWGYGEGVDFTPVQLGGLTYRVPASAVGKEIFVQVTATNTGGSDVEYSTGLEVLGSAPTPARLPRIGPQEVVVGDTVSGAQGTWIGYPAPQVTDWGFAEFSLPNPIPIPAANKVYRYQVPPSMDGKRLCFYVTAENTLGSDTAYSAPTDVVYDELKPDTLPTLTGFQSPAQYGNVIKGTPGSFDPNSAYQYSYFAYVETSGALTEIAGTRGTTTYTLGSADLGKQIVYASYGENNGKYGTETLTIQSNSTGIIRRFAKVLTPGSLTFSGPAPLIGATCQCIAGTTDPALVGAMPGPVLATLQIGYLLNGTIPVYFQEVTTGWTSPYSFTVPVEADGCPLFFDWTAHYDDSPSTPGEIQIIGAQRVGLTPPVEGVKPYQTAEGSWAPGNQFNPGQTITWVPGTYAGVPTPTLTWTWQRLLPDGGTVLLQNGGLTYTLPDDSAGWKVYIIEVARNAAGVLADSYPAQTIGGPLPVFTRLPIITGSNLMTPTASTTLNCITPLARDPITGQDIPVTWQWMVQYGGGAPIPLGHPFTSFEFFNENGRWTGGQVYIQGTATNSIGTVTCESNRVSMLGTPRILSSGTLYSGILPNRFGLNPCTSDGGGQTVINSWSADVVGAGSQVLAQVIYPATQTSSVFTGTGVGQGNQAMRNSQGETIYNFPTINVQFP